MAVAQILYPPRSRKDADRVFRKCLGYSTEKAVSTGISRPRAWGGEQQDRQRERIGPARALMLPQELREMPWTQEIIITTGIKPILCDKALYFSDPVFMNQLKALESHAEGNKRTAYGRSTKGGRADQARIVDKAPADRRASSRRQGGAAHACRQGGRGDYGGKLDDRHKRAAGNRTGG